MSAGGCVPPDETDLRLRLLEARVRAIETQLRLARLDDFRRRLLSRPPVGVGELSVFIAVYVGVMLGLFLAFT